jgi:hypothetical protein
MQDFGSRHAGVRGSVEGREAAGDVRLAAEALDAVGARITRAPNLLLVTARTAG